MQQHYKTGLLVTLGLLVGMIALAEPPSPPLAVPPAPTPTPALPTPALPPMATQPAPSAVERKIRSALERGAADETGNPVLDDILGIIRERGSVLDGSALDPAMGLDAAPRDDARSVAGVPTDQQARAAEMLLKAARMLSGLDSQPAGRRELVNRMRAEAVILLSE